MTGVQTCALPISQPRQEMLYIDANNLYGHALSKRLPKSNFSWLTEQEIESLTRNLSTVDLDSDVGYLLEVDLAYPDEIHSKTACFPFAPEKLKIHPSLLSPFMNDLSQSLYNSSPKTYSKLLLTQFDKPKYVVHAKLLQFYLKMGMRVDKIHRGLKFIQDFVFNQYISYNSTKRQQAVNNFEKDFYKLKNNALYGKTVENVRRRMSFRICNDAASHMKLASKPSYLKSIVFNQNLTGVHLSKEIATLDKDRKSVV